MSVILLQLLFTSSDVIIGALGGECAAWVVDVILGLGWPVAEVNTQLYLIVKLQFLFIGADKRNRFVSNDMVGWLVVSFTYN